MKKIFLCVISLIGLVSIHAQVGINTITPDESAALDITSTNKGILIPRMTTAQRTAIITPASGLIVYDTNLKCISQNVGTPTAPSWVCLSAKSKQSESFYMPSIAIDASTVVAGKSIDLYDEYKKQFNTPTARSGGAPISIPFFPVSTDLYYYVSYYDNTILKINSINTFGVMNYDVIKESDYHSFMNVVFVVK